MLVRGSICETENLPMQIKDIITHIENLAPLSFQESYDNAGLIVGQTTDEVHSALICLDVTEAVIDEAIANNHQLIISHHPLIFSGIKKINGKNEVERCVIKAIRNQIAIYAAHTNFDAVHGGVNSMIASKIDLQNTQILSPLKGKLQKLVTFIPQTHFHAVESALFKAGAGNIGNYDSCAFTSLGEGSFRGNDKSNPFVGEKGTIHRESEVRLESIFPSHLQHNIIQALKESHPYESVAFDLIDLANELENAGSGMIGELSEAIDEQTFLAMLKETFQCGIIRHSALLGKKIKRVAICGGSGSFLIEASKMAKADIFITGDMKYHDFFRAEKQLILADIGHFESEQFTQHIFHELLIKKIPNFAVHLTAQNTNAVNYF